MDDRNEVRDPVPITIYDSSTSRILEGHEGFPDDVPSPTASSVDVGVGKKYDVEMPIDKRDQIGVRSAGDVQLSPRDNNNVNHNNPETVAKEYMRRWMDSFRYEQNNSTSLVIYLQSKLHEALRSSDRLGNPNEFRTAVCCHLLDIICRTFGRYSELVDQLKMEIYASIYIDKDALFERLEGLNGEPTAETFIDFQPYFQRSSAF